MTTSRSLYGQIAHVIFRQPTRVILFVVASVLHAIGHACVAGIAGILVRALLLDAGGGGFPRGIGSTGRQIVTAGATGGIDVAFLTDKSDPAVVVAAVGLGAMVLKVAGQTWSAYLQAQLAGDVGVWMRQRVLDTWLSVHRLRATRHDDHGAYGGNSGPWAQHVAALTYRVRELESGLEVGLLGGVRAATQIVPLIVLLIILSPRLAGASALVFVPFAALLGHVRKKYKRGLAARATQGDALLEAADEAVRHADLWATYGAGERVRAHIERLGRAMTVHAARMEAAAATLSGSNEVLGALALVLALAAARAGWLGQGGAGALLPFAIVFFLAYRPLRELTDARLALSRARVAMETLKSLNVDVSADVDVNVDGDGDGHVSDPPKRLPAWAPAPLEVASLVCARGDAGPISFRAEPGQIVVILGRTGVGKTTFLRTLLGLDRPRDGTLRYGDAALTDVPIGPAARPFAWVPQDSPLLLDTLEANVRVSPDADAAGASLDALGAGHLVTRLGGQRLGAEERPVSGGERQWIALARAMATKMPVLLLDEPTSGLDGEAQARVLDAIANLRGRRTVVLVTHRAEPVGIADVVVRL